MKLIRVSLMLLGLGMAVAACAPPPAPVAPPVLHHVKYEVEGTATSAVVIYLPGTSAQDTTIGVKPLPMVPLEYDAPAGHFLHLDAGNTSPFDATKPDQGTVTCRISVDGAVVSEHTADSALVGGQPGPMDAECTGTA